MSGLVLKLAPGERVLINGAVIENGDNRGRLRILSQGTNILRLRDAIHPADASTPVARLCYGVQLILTGDADLPAMRDGIAEGIEALAHVFEGTEDRAVLDAARRALIEERPYYVLKHLRRLLPREAMLLSSAPTLSAKGTYASPESARL